MAQKKPNTLCKNIHCTKGKDGGRKLFYTCKYCVHVVSNQSVACCDECFEEYQKQVQKARESGHPYSFEQRIAERTDMESWEVMNLVFGESTDDVIRETEEELAEELAENPELNFSMISQRINEELDNENESEEGDA